MEIRKYNFSEGSQLKELVQLQNEVYRDRNLHFSVDEFRLWYVANPEGEVISYNAYENGRMIAHQALIPERMWVGERIVRCLRAMAVVTHPEYRGMGLLSILTNRAIEDARRQGYEFVYAVTNYNSFPVFIKHCDFKFVTRLHVKIGWGSKVSPNPNIMFHRHWTEESLVWRMSLGNYYHDGKHIYGKYSYGVETFMGTMDRPLLQKGVGRKNFSFHSLRPKLYVGIGARLPFTYWNVPHFIKRSPFNLIYRDLTEGKLPVMTADNVFYQLIDYDVA